MANVQSAVCVLALLAAAEGFAPMNAPVGGRMTLRRGVSAQRPAKALNLNMVDIPRVTLPSSVTDVLKEQDLKNPNDLSATDYNTYSAAAIGGTLVFMVLGTQIFDVSGLIFDFMFAALTGGGAAAYAALRKDEASEYANKFGAALLQGAENVVKDPSLPRVTLPAQVTDVLKEQDLKNPNDLTAADYNTYSAAAIGGTLVFMVLGTQIFDVSGMIFDFMFAALTGGGAAAYAALRKDEASEYANKFGAALLQAVDTAVEKVSK